MKEYDLSEQQEIAFNFLKEFYSPQKNRASGRSYLMACLIIETALSNPCIPVNIIDHHDIVSGHQERYRNNRFMVDLVHEILSRFPEDIQQGVKFSPTNATFEYIPQQPNKRVVLDQRIFDDMEKI